MSRRLLGEQDLLSAFQALSDELVNLGSGRQEIRILGGAAVILLLRRRGDGDGASTTHDIDTAHLLPHIVKEAARRVASRLGLPEDWLSDDSARFVRQAPEGAEQLVRGPACGKVLFETQALVVRSVSIEHLLATKLAASRDDVDLCDARLLVAEMERADKYCDRDRIWIKLVPHLLPGAEKKASESLDDIWEEIHGFA